MLYGNYCYIIIESFPKKFSPCSFTRHQLTEAEQKLFRMFLYHCHILIRGSNVALHADMPVVVGESAVTLPKHQWAMRRFIWKKLAKVHIATTAKLEGTHQED